MKLDDLINSTSTTSTTESKTPDYSWNLGFDVVSAVEEEKKSAKETAREKLANHLKERSNLRKAMRSWEKSSWNKDVDNKTINTSALADAFTEVMVWMGKDPQYMQETYWSTSQGNLDLINKMKGLQWGKFSWDIQGYMDGKNQDLTWLLNNMFPDYYKNKWATTPTVTIETEKKVEQPKWITWDERSAWDKMVDKAVNFKWSDIWLASENRPIKWIANILWWFIDTTQKIVPWTMDIFNSLTMTSPEKFNKYLDEWYYMQDWVKKNAKEAYDRAVKYQWYKWSYNQWVNDSKKSYEDFYTQSTTQSQQVDKDRWDFWFNTMDEESTAFKSWELGSEVVQQIALDKWLTSLFSKAGKAYKAIKWTEEAAKWTELATKWTELALKWWEVVADTAKATETAKESKNIAQKFIDWYKKPWIWQDIVKWWVEWWKAWAEFQLIWDVQNWQLSDAQTYGMNAAIASILWSTLWLFWWAWRNIVEPNEKIRTSLSRMWVKDVDDVLDWSISASKDGTLPSAKQRVSDMVVTEAKKNVKEDLSNAWQELWAFRKSLPTSNITVNDFNNTINKALTKKWIWAQIVEKDWAYVLDWYPWQYWDVLNKIVDRMNSAVQNMKNKYQLYTQWEAVDFWTNTSVFEDLLSDLKSFSIREPNAEVKQQMIEIEKSLMEDLKWAMWEKQYSKYEELLNNYSNLKNRSRKIDELETKMKSTNVNEQPKMEDWQYLSDFLEELYSDKKLSRNYKDMRIAAIFSDALYWVPLKPWETVPYPSKAWWLEEVQRWLTKLVRNPKSSVTWWWKQYAKDYVPSKTKTVLKKAAKEGKDVTIWKLSTWEGDLD